MGTSGTESCEGFLQTQFKLALASITSTQVEFSKTGCLLEQDVSSLKKKLCFLAFVGLQALFKQLQ